MLVFSVERFNLLAAIVTNIFLFVFTDCIAEELRVPKFCPDDEKKCVEVDMNYRPDNGKPSGLRDDEFFIEEYPTHEPQWNTFRLRLTGSLNGAPPETHEILLGQFDGMDCQDFRVPIVGLTGNRGATIYTDQGDLEITDTPFKFGCKDCVATIDKTNLTPTFKISPSWDLHDFSPKLIFHSDGRYYWKTKRACLDIESGDLFREVDAGNCKIGQYFWNTDVDCKDVKADSRLKKYNSEICTLPKLENADKETINRLKARNIFGNIEAADHFNERLKYDLYMLPRAKFLIYKYGVACT